MYKDLQKISNYTKYLSALTVSNAKSGHTGAAVGMSDFLTVLYAKHLNFDINTPTAINRDRFVLSNGHASALLYSLLYMADHKDISIEDLKNFRQFNSKTAGHPEIEHLAGVDVSTGPLGQGLATAVGLAIAEKKLTAEKNKPFNHTFVTVGDGCLSEGISHEALELAAHLKLNRLIVMFDNNEITIDGKTSLFTSTDIAKRMKAYGFNVIKVDGHNLKAIDKAITKAKKSNDKPSFIMFNTVIGKDTAKANTNTIHGYPLKPEELENFKQALKVDANGFEFDNSIKELFKTIHDKKDFTAITEELYLDNSKNLNNALTALKKAAIEENVNQATRASIGECIDVTTRVDKHFISGSADLTPSNCTKSKTMVDITPNSFIGNYIHYGIKEHAMGSIANGINLYSNTKQNIAVGTFLSFADYMKPSLRMAALMHLPVQFVFTHDSIGVGEDGPTHQPVEHIVSLRAIPNSYTFRPADMVETVEAWQAAMNIRTAPSFHLLSRQNLDLLRTEFSNENKVATGGYVIYQENTQTPDAIFVASGSEVKLAVDAAKKLNAEGKNVWVVSMPCYELFEEQTAEYKESVLPKDVTNTIAIEAGSKLGLAAVANHFICLDEFGKSAKADELFKHYNFTVDFAYNKALELI